MVESTDLRRRFENIVSEIFRLEGFKLKYELAAEDYRADLFVESPSGNTAVLELKLYRTRQLSFEIVSRLTELVERIRRSARADRGVLITLSRVFQRDRTALTENNSRLVIFDYDAMISLAGKHPRVAAQLDNLARDVLVTTVDLADAPEVAEIPPPSLKILDRPPLAPPEQLAPSPEPPVMGANLCQEIRAIKKGSAGARQFEQKVEEALKYIFDTDLSAWSSQRVSQGGLSRYDLIARVTSNHDLWKMLVERFHSQYIIFEFKNHREKIRQGEIYSTERYLYTKALRTTAIIISRYGADRNALAAARGALRENGKLIVNLSVDELCKLLALRDDGQDCNGAVFEIIDEMLMTIER